MHLICPRCTRNLEYTVDRPSFCSHCGQSLVGVSTQTYEPPAHAAEAVTLPPPPPGSQTSTQAYLPDGGSGAAPPERIGGYRLLRPLGGGGMGMVYEAEDLSSGRYVALKLIATAAARSKEAVDRFRQEGRLASSIHHARCVFVLAADEDQGRPYIAMERMPGTTLKDVVDREGPLPVERAVAMILDVIEGLMAAHALGVIHRDVKPSNCFLDKDGRVKVGDFGLAKSLAQDAQLTRTGAFMGTPLFASPEQIKGERVDEQTDVYAVAATLYALLTGQAPFQSTDATVTLARIVSDPAPSMRSLHPEITAGLDDVVLRGLERDRGRRWRRLDELREALLVYLPGQLKPAGLAIRFAAYAFDWLILSPIGVAGAILGMQSVFRPELEWLFLLTMCVDSALSLFYFALPEGVYGWSLGKRILGLRVYRAEISEPPGWQRGVTRWLIWWIATSSHALLLSFLFSRAQVGADPLLSATISPLQVLLPLVGTAVLFWTARSGNGYRGLHEIWSGTRTVHVPTAPKRRPLMSRRLELAAQSDQGLPERVETFVVKGRISESAHASVLLAEDPSLDRKVFIEFHRSGLESARQARRDISRSTRLLWLDCGRQDQEQWEVFLAPTGCPLRELVNTCGKMTWADARPIIRELTDELHAAMQDGSLPASLLPGQVWIRPDGSVQLLDHPLLPPQRPTPQITNPEMSIPLTDPDERALQLLREVVPLMLEGRVRQPGEADSVLRAPVPEHARELTDRLCKRVGGYRHVSELRDALIATDELPTHTTSGRRATHLAMLASLLGLGLLFCLMPVGCMSELLDVVVLTDDAIMQENEAGNLDLVSHGELAAGLMSPQPVLGLRAALQWDVDQNLCRALRSSRDHHQEKLEARLRSMSSPMRALSEQVQEEIGKRLAAKAKVPFMGRWHAAYSLQQPYETPDRTAFIVIAGIWPAVWIVWAFCTRGGLILRRMGFCLVRADGRPAARWRCAWRAFLVWGPLFAIWAASLWIDGWYWSTWMPGRGMTWLPWLTWSMWWLGILLLPVYVALALINPVRSPVDRLAGTYVMPK